MSRQIKGGDEQDAYTRWRHLLRWRPGQIKKIKRATHKRERRQDTAFEEMAALTEEPGLYEDGRREAAGECRHGCNGSPCGSEACTFICHGSNETP